MQNKEFELERCFKQCQLSIADVWLDVRLGHTQEERAQEQKVKVDLLFERDLVACYSDRLDDTFCYAQLISEVQESLNGEAFCLIEKLAMTLARYVYQKTGAHFTITVTKYVTLLNAGQSRVSFSLSNIKK